MHKRLLFLLLFVCLGLSSISNAQRFKFSRPSDATVLQKKHPIYTNAETAILSKNIDVRVSDGNSGSLNLIQEFTIRKKLYVITEATENIDILVIPGQRLLGLKIYEITSINNEIERERVKDSEVKVFTEADGTKRFNLNFSKALPGTIVDYRYTLVSNYIDLLPKFYFQDTIPVDAFHLLFSSPEYLKYYFYKQGAKPFRLTLNGKPVNQDTNVAKNSNNTSFFQGFSTNDTFEASLQDIPPYPNTEFASSYANFASAITFQLGYTLDYDGTKEPVALGWGKFLKTLREQVFFGEQYRDTDFLSDVSKTFLSSSETPKQKMQAIFNYVQNRMNWNGNYGTFTQLGVRTAFLNLTGNVADINLLLVALLKDAGLNANPLLVSTKANGIPVFAAPTTFDYVMAKVNIGSDSYILDATSKLANTNALESETMNFRGLEVLPREGFEWVSLYPHGFSSVDVLSKLSLSGKIVSGTSQVRYSGNKSLELKRDAIDNSSPKIDSIITAQNPKLDYSKIEASPLDDSNLKLLTSYEVPSSSISNKEITFNLLPLFLFQENPFKDNFYGVPIDFRYRSIFRQTINIAITDANFKLVEQPKEIELVSESGGLSYISKSTRRGDEIIINYSLKINKPIVSGEFKEEIQTFFDNVLTHQKTVFKLKKG